jgi:hypothetical protein
MIRARVFYKHYRNFSEEHLHLLLRKHECEETQWFTLMDPGDNAFALYYCGRARECDEYLERAYRKGLVSALAFMKNVNIELLEKHKEDPDVCYKLSKIIKNIPLVKISAINGNMFGMKEYARLIYRYVLYTGDVKMLFNTRDDKKRFLIGQALDGYESFWDPGHQPFDWQKACIEFYRDIAHSVRRSALFITFALRCILGRDVARLIGQLVYDSRANLENPEPDWFIKKYRR